MSLVNAGANVNARTDKGWFESDDGWTPLHMAAKSGHVEIIAVLVEAGADVNALDDDDRTPLRLARDAVAIAALRAAGATK